MKILIAQLNPTIGAITSNTLKAIVQLEEARKRGARFVVFPELFLSGYPPEDLLHHAGFIEACEKAVEEITLHSKDLTVFIGCPRKNSDGLDKALYNSCAIISDGKVIGYQDKTLLPTYDIFDERRFFAPAKKHTIWNISGHRIVITICEDIWPFTNVEGQEQYPEDPLKEYQGKDITLHINISASPYSLGKLTRRAQVAEAAAKRLSCPLVLCNQVGAQDGILFDGTSLVLAQDGSLLYQLKSFEEDVSEVDFAHAVPQKSSMTYESEELYSALVMGLMDYFHKQGFRKACLGLSGGVDSSVVAALAVEALGADQVTGYLLPSRFTSVESREDAEELARRLGIKTMQLSIEKPFHALLDTLSPVLKDKPFDIVEENMQARIRGLLLMTISNNEGSLLLNTSNKSELAVGYSTLYGDSCGAIAVLGDLLKSQVYAVANYIRKKDKTIPQRVIDKAPTAELRLNQKDTDTIPEYSVLDPLLEAYVVRGESVEKIAADLGVSVDFVSDVVRKIHMSEYKRRQCPFALRVSDKAFSYGRRVPIVQRFFISS